MNRPFVYINMATTVDGKITSAAREYPRFASEHDRRNMDILRARADAILVGAGTIRADNPSLLVRDDGLRQYRRSLGKPQGPMKVLVTAGASIDTDYRFFKEEDGGARLIATVEEASEENLAAFEGKAEVLKIGSGAVDLPGLLAELKRRGVDKLLAEGGGETNWRLIDDDLVDELFITVAPSLLGGRDAPTAVEGDGFTMERQIRMRLLEMRREEDEIFCRYEVIR
jgi:2,5-diamino-6-(ribosylamino)-4(3H)-pyrimidinone 5'-phosphate reductase